jgi:hypothetical protein
MDGWVECGIEECMDKWMDRLMDMDGVWQDWTMDGWMYVGIGMYIGRWIDTLDLSQIQYHTRQIPRHRFIHTHHHVLQGGSEAFGNLLEDALVIRLDFPPVPTVDKLLVITYSAECPVSVVGRPSTHLEHDTVNAVNIYTRVASTVYVHHPCGYCRIQKRWNCELYGGHQ